jgi:AAA domain, putative AbiEii toxin, Type IV TA system
MLLRFAIHNHRALRDPIELSLQSEEGHARHVLGLVGPSGAGKTSLISALELLPRLLVAERDLPELLEAWALQRGPDAPASRWSLDFLIEGQRHHYDLAVDGEGVQDEWLFRWEGGRQQLVFQRDRREEDPWYFGPGLAGRSLAARTPSTGTFLRAASALPALAPVHHHLSRLCASPRAPDLRRLAQGEQRAMALELLRMVDPGLVGLRMGPQGLMVQRRVGASAFELPLRAESEGTITLLHRLAEAMEHLEQPDAQVLLWDSLDLAAPGVALLAGLYCSPHGNRRGQQLIFTSRHTDLRARGLELLRLDAGRPAGLGGASQLRRAS